MATADPSSASAGDPVGRVIRVHQSSLGTAQAARRRRPSPTGAAGARRVSDARQCRIRVDALQREIDRLRRGMDRVEMGAAAGPGVCAGLRVDEEREPDRLASPPRARMPYAADALGKVATGEEETAPLRKTTVVISNYCYITNLGTLFDVLA